MTNLKRKLQKRWGRKFKDNRNWRSYNEQLVKRGEYLLALDFVERWDEELTVMNFHKQGAPFRFPKTMIELQSLWHAKKMPYRMIEGMTRDLVKLGSLPEYNNYSTINRRLNKLNFCLALPQGDSTIVFSDGSGLQAVAGGEYLREKYGKKNRRWVQIVLLGDAEHHEPLSYEIHIVQESESDSSERQLVSLLQQGTNITAFGGDGGLDAKHLWHFCNDQKIKPIIKPDKNALEDTDCEPRNRVVRQRNKVGYKKWSKKIQYGYRWPATEGIFSAVKRIFGEQLAATSERGMLHEAACKIWAYQKLKRYGEA